MPTSLPPSVREHFGEPVAEDFAQWLEETLQERTVRRDEYREVLSRLDVIDERFEQLERRFDERLDEMEKRFNVRLDQMQDQLESRAEQVDERFEQIDSRFEQIDGRFEQIDGRFESMDAKLDRMNDRILSMTRWVIGLIALFGTLVTALLAAAQFGG